METIQPCAHRPTVPAQTISSCDHPLVERKWAPPHGGRGLGNSTFRQSMWLLKTFLLPVQSLSHVIIGWYWHMLCDFDKLPMRLETIQLAHVKKNLYDMNRASPVNHKLILDYCVEFLRSPSIAGFVHLSFIMHLKQHLLIKKHNNQVWMTRNQNILWCSLCFWLSVTWKNIAYLAKTIKIWNPNFWTFTIWPPPNQH